MKFLKSFSAVCMAFLMILCVCTDILKKNDDQKVDVPPPTPTGINALYDTVHGRVFLTWNAVAAADLAGYIVYRTDPSSSTQLRLNDSLIVDTVFNDTLFKNPSDTAERIVTYRVKAQDKAGHESDYYSDPITVIAPSPSALHTTIALKILNHSGDFARIYDTITIGATYQNAGRQNMRLQWFAGRKDSLVKTVSDTARSGGDTIALSWSDTGLKSIYVAITDRSLAVWWVSVAVVIARDIPVVNAGKDSGVWVGDTIALHGAETQRFGKVAKWEWKLGSGNWTVCSGPDTVFIAPVSEHIVVCSLAVTDDIGTRVAAEKKITVYQHLLAIADGWDHNVFLKTDGTAWTCGHNHDGQLGDGTFTDQIVPVKVMSDVGGIFAGSSQTLFIKTDNSLWACGFSKLGNGSVTGGPTPVKVMSDVLSVAEGSNHNLVLKTDGSVWACGDNSHYQLGIVSENAVVTPVHVMDSVQSIAAGFNHCLALKTNKTLWAWGQNWNGQCGTGATLESAIYPVQVLTGVQAISAGSSHSLALKTDGTLWACGFNGQGQLGNGTTKDTSRFIQIATNVKTIVAGVENSMFLKTDGSLWACGYNTSGQLGDATAVSQTTPVRIMDNVQRFAPAYTHTLFLKTDGTVWACGDNTYGQFGDGTVAPRMTPGRIVPLLK